MKPIAHRRSIQRSPPATRDDLVRVAHFLAYQIRASEYRIRRSLRASDATAGKAAAVVAGINRAHDRITDAIADGTPP